MCNILEWAKPCVVNYKNVFTRFDNIISNNHILAKQH